MGRAVVGALVGMGLFVGSAFAQQGPVDLGALDPAEYFSFLAGDWTYSFNGGGGEVTYADELDGRVVRESLQGQIGGNRFSGSSLIFFDPATESWNQRWVDSFGNVLSGAISVIDYPESDVPALVAEFEFQGAIFRHVWYDMTHGRFETDLLVSQNGGEFQLTRRAPYVRR